MAAQMNPIWNQILTAHHSASPDKSHDITRATSQDAGATSTSNSNSATISANDFLTLLVSEMKNQDPTANTDPNEYINQLVQVNSLEQLISINQTLTADSSATPSGSAVNAVGFKQPSKTSAPEVLEGGNLSIPKNNPAAQRLAGALSVQTNKL
jgi:flagellar basal-body rod modification protein FlgD